MTSQRPPLIAYVTSFESQDIHAWSGLIYHIKRALTDAGAEAESLSNLKKGALLTCGFKKLFYQFVRKKDYHRDREPQLMKSYSQQINRLLRPEHDLVFSPGTLAIGSLETDKPTAIWTDATFANLVESYPEYQNLCEETLRNGHAIEREFLSNAAVAIYASDWAARSAIDYYGADPDRVKVVPFGANIKCERDPEFIATNTSSKSDQVCRLLFIGVDWERKGGPTALAVASRLQERGIKVELHVVGVEPPHEVPSHVICHGYLSKQNPNDYRKFHKLMLSSHFLILPSRAECFGIVFAEAASYGLPSLATKVGGISSAVTEGQSGFLFEPDCDPGDYCEIIEKHFKSPESYRELASSSFAVYQDRLNWEIAGQKALQYLTEAIEADRKE
jgi:glycosyltransferase involved in cell wall biosynthesis